MSDTGKSQLVTRIGERLIRFMHVESTAGIMLAAATVAAMLVKNSPLSEAYTGFLLLEGQVRVGSLDVNKPLVLWVNDLWMAIFFFVVGLEIRREWLYGHLRDRSQMVLPVVGAIFGVAVPALVFVAVNWQDSESIRGWAIPTATDIAFALAVLSLLGDRVPGSLRVFLMTLAILDDLIAILVIAFFYTAGLSWTSATLALLVLLALVTLRRLGMREFAPYFLLGLVLWLCVLKSGIHATLAGVAVAFLIPAETEEGRPNVLERIIEDLHPWVAFLILPAFAFVNAGIDFSLMNMAGILTPLPLGVFLGLFVGKLVGVSAAVFLCVRLGLTPLPGGCGWLHILGVSALCGIGFTMSLFIGGLAFVDSGIGYARIDRFAVILASLCSALLGYGLLKLAARRSAG